MQICALTIDVERSGPMVKELYKKKS